MKHGQPKNFNHSHKRHTVCIFASATFMYLFDVHLGRGKEVWCVDTAPQPSGLRRVAKNEGRGHPLMTQSRVAPGALCGPALHPRVEGAWCQTWCWLAHSIFRPHGSPGLWGHDHPSYRWGN